MTLHASSSNQGKQVLEKVVLMVMEEEGGRTEGGMEQVRKWAQTDNDFGVSVKFKNSRPFKARHIPVLVEKIVVVEGFGCIW